MKKPMVYLTNKETHEALIKEQKKKIVEQWIQNNGAASFDLENEDIFLWDGGMFSVEKEPVMRSKIIGYKKLLNGNSEVLFSKKKYKDFDLKAVFWMSELQEFIDYLNRMKRMLNSLGYKTNTEYNKKKSINCAVCKKEIKNPNPRQKTCSTICARKYLKEYRIKQGRERKK